MAVSEPAVLRLRRMRWWDIEPVMAMEQEIFAEDAWSSRMFWSELADPATCHYIVLTQADPGGETVVGYAGLGVAAGQGEVRTIGVTRSRQNRGLGAKLLSALLEDAVRRGCVEVFLEVRVDNVSAQHLYERFGFRSVGIRRGYYQPANVDALVMRLGLPRRRTGWPA